MHLDRADQLVQVRAVAELRDAARRSSAPRRCRKPRPLLPMRARRRPRSPCACHSLHLLEHQAQHVGVQAAAQALVGGDDDDADALHRVARRPGTDGGTRGWRARCGRDVADLLAVRTRVAHALLRLAHLGRGDHLHRLGDLLRVLHALDLVADFFACRPWLCSFAVQYVAVLLEVLDRGAAAALRRPWSRSLVVLDACRRASA